MHVQNVNAGSAEYEADDMYTHVVLRSTSHSVNHSFQV